MFIFIILARPSIKTKTKSKYVTVVKRELFIPCSWNDLTGLPTWTFQGKSGGTKTLSANIDAAGLTLKDLKIESEGSYTCSASNNYGGANFTATVQVIGT